MQIWAPLWCRQLIFPKIIGLDTKKFPSLLILHPQLAWGSWWVTDVPGNGLSSSLFPTLLNYYVFLPEILHVLATHLILLPTALCGHLSQDMVWETTEFKIYDLYCFPQSSITISPFSALLPRANLTRMYLERGHCHDVISLWPTPPDATPLL